MIRSLLFAIGIFLLVLGAQSLVVDKWIMSYSDMPLSGAVSSAFNSNRPFQTAGYSNLRQRYYNRSDTGNIAKRVYQTREWMPWSLLAAGTYRFFYSYSSGGRHSGSD